MLLDPVVWTFDRLWILPHNLIWLLTCYQKQVFYLKGRRKERMEEGNIQTNVSLLRKINPDNIYT